MPSTGYPAFHMIDIINTVGGNGEAVVRLRDIADSKDQIVATMDGAERSAIARDAG
ncbi:hypothetical protein H6F43_17020 [Leptolyngbya sp. FACHB-36]|uniref:hypothetical protein n=1 Tax=Leptolyngbya sp. FACHB-36 TaxID=2692808 RepID=UPI001680806C|nr:hypothetical protein [Leptolyngbya sp. FACHB-36]MBD2021885.1 hypothetical protein [Leptolyngbya sp. FACHB-36]